MHSDNEHDHCNEAEARVVLLRGVCDHVTEAEDEVHADYIGNLIEHLHFVEEPVLIWPYLGYIDKCREVENLYNHCLKDCLVVGMQHDNDKEEPSHAHEKALKQRHLFVSLQS